MPKKIQRVCNTVQKDGFEIRMQMARLKVARVCALTATGKS